MNFEIRLSSIALLACSMLLGAGCKSSGGAAVKDPSPPTGDSNGPGAPTVAGSGCSVPTAPASTAEETAWRLFVAINCKNASGQLTWETWQTQACLDNPDDCDTVARLHGSVSAKLARSPQAADEPKRTGGCEAMTTASAKPPASLVPFIPTNLSVDPVFCEEVTVNGSELAYAKTHGLLTTDGQTAFLKSGKTINFPSAAIEVKADWVPASFVYQRGFRLCQSLVRHLSRGNSRHLLRPGRHSP